MPLGGDRGSCGRHSGDPSENLQSPIHAPQSLAVAHADADTESPRALLGRVLRRVEWMASVDAVNTLVAAVLSNDTRARPMVADLLAEALHGACKASVAAQSGPCATLSRQ